VLKTNYYNRHIKLICFIALFVISFCPFMCKGGVKNKKACIVLTLPHDLEDVASHIKSSIKASFLLKKLTYDSDVTFTKKEFLYLIGLKEGEEVRPEDMQQAVSFLIKKKKFKKIILTICPYEDGKTVHIDLKGFWEFKKLKLHGVFVGKENYRKYYLLEHGDVFNLDKHRHSLDKICDAFSSEGYFEGRVASSISYDKDTKSAHVNITLHRNKKFSIGDVAFVLKDRTRKDEKTDQLKVLLKKIDALFKKRFLKKSYSKSLINNETRKIKRYLSKKGFLHVDIGLREKINNTDKTVTLTFAFDIHSKKEFIFFGNSFFSDSQLLDKILLFGRSAWLVPASILSGEIEKAYYQHGFWNIEVESKEEPEGYFFLIKEGKRASVDQVDLIDVKSFDEALLVNSCFVDLFRVKYFDAEVLNDAISSLMDFYLKEGFWDIKILKQSFVSLDVENAYKVELTIDEGKRRYLTGVTIKGFEDLLEQGPFAALEKESLKVPFNPILLKEQRKWLVQYFKGKGYLHIEVNPDLQTDGENVSVAWIVEPGKLVTFGKTVILGASSFPIDCVTRELMYKEGEVWDNEKLKKSISRVRSLGMFEHAYLYPWQVSVAQESKDVLIKLLPDDPFEVRFRMGLGLRNVGRDSAFFHGVTYMAGGSFLFRNPTNCSDQFWADLDFARSYRNICFSYARPWIFNKPIKTLCKLYANRYDQPGFVGSKKNLYEVTQEGFLVNLQKIYKCLDFSTNIGFEWMNTKIKRDMFAQAKCIADAINFDSKLLGIKIPYLLLEPTLLIYNLDNKLNPTYGTFSLLSCKGMFPLHEQYANSFFVKILCEQSFFYPLFNCVVFGLRLRFGHVFHQKFKDISPIERFYLGGAHSIRSYDTDLCPPLGSFVDEGNCVRFAPQGGKSMINMNFEVKFPVYRAIGAVLFQDLGSLACDGLDTSNLLAGTGFGLRFATPAGPIRFDIGWKWKRRKSFESSYAWFLSFGNTF